MQPREHDRLVLVVAGRRQRLSGDLVPADPRPDPDFLDAARQRWTASSFYPAFRPSARVYKLALRMKAFLSLGARRSGLGASLEEFLQDRLDGVHDAVVLIGTEGPGQKLIARLRGPQGKTLAYLKYAERARARALVEQEAAVLEQLPEDARIEGALLQAQGFPGPIRVSAVNEEVAILDFNHPLAGKDITFDIIIVAVADAPPPPSLMPAPAVEPAPTN